MKRFWVYLCVGACILGGCGDSSNDTLNRSPDVEVAEDTGFDDSATDVGTDDSDNADSTRAEDTFEAQDTGADVALDTTSADTAPDDVAMDDVAVADSDEGDTAQPDADPLEACRADIVSELAWNAVDEERPLPGTFELAQTHILEANDTRHAPPWVEGREGLLLFTPETSIPTETVLYLSAWDGGTLLGVLPFAEPAKLPPPLEASLTTEPIAPYSEEAWSIALPWQWIHEGHTLRVGYIDGSGVRYTQDHQLEGLGAPHRFTVSRTKIVLFGDEEFDTRTQPAPRIAKDFFAALPFAELRWVDYLPWHLDSIVVRTDAGPRLVSSETERRAVASDDDHWSILKHQLALRLSLANTGRGLGLTGESDGDSSPYSLGTSVGMGWFLDPDGLYLDIDDAPWAAGWTGWTAMWANECGNGFIHELGHSLTLAHFTDGAAEQWGIGEEYPSDGTNLATHPWGYDTTRRMLRTWYRVDANGPVVNDEGGWVGKRDPMNGGEAPNAMTCFPQYTSYHAEKIQRWAETSPTLLNIDGVPGVYLWDTTSRTYAPYSVEASLQSPTAVDVPVVTLIGTLGDTDDVSQTYPALHAPSGNVFDVPDPFEAGLPELYTDARWFLEIVYTDGPSEHALIAQGTINDSNLYLYSLNLDARRAPSEVRLYRAAQGYPSIELEQSELVHTRAISTASDEDFDPIVTVGRGALANGKLRLTQSCGVDANCDTRYVESTWRLSAGSLHFNHASSPAPELCTSMDDYSVLTIPVIEASGQRAELTVHAQRIVRSADGVVAVPIHDTTPWFASPDVVQSLRVWVPWSANEGLQPGYYRNDGAFTVQALVDGLPLADVPIVVDVEVLERTDVDLTDEAFRTPPLTAPDSSMYYLVRDPQVGPTSRVWWDDGVDGPTVLRIPVHDTESGDLTTLYVEAYHDACGTRIDFNAGRGADNCEDRVVLTVSEGERNAHLMEGHSYRTLPSAPVVVEGRRWHEPRAELLIGVFALSIHYTH